MREKEREGGREGGKEGRREGGREREFCKEVSRVTITVAGCCQPRDDTFYPSWVGPIILYTIRLQYAIHVHNIIIHTCG